MFSYEAHIQSHEATRRTTTGLLAKPAAQRVLIQQIHLSLPHLGHARHCYPQDMCWSMSFYEWQHVKNHEELLFSIAFVRNCLPIVLLLLVGFLSRRRMFTCCRHAVLRLLMSSIDLVFWYILCFLSPMHFHVLYILRRSFCVSLLANGSGFFNSSLPLLHVMPFSCRSGSMAGAHQGDSDAGCDS